MDPNFYLYSMKSNWLVIIIITGIIVISYRSVPTYQNHLLLSSFRLLSKLKVLPTSEAFTLPIFRLGYFHAFDSLRNKHRVY